MKLKRLTSLASGTFLCLALATAGTATVLGSESSVEEVVSTGGTTSGEESGNGETGGETTGAASTEGTAGAVFTESAAGAVAPEPEIKEITTSAIHFINNEKEDSDYKVDTAEISRLQEIMQRTHLVGIEKDETESFLQRQPTQDLSALEGGSLTKQDSVSATDAVRIAKGYLVRNNCYSRPESIAWDGSSFQHTLLDNTSWLADSSNASKTEFLSILYKIRFGPVHSRPVVFKKSSIRTSGGGEVTQREYWNGSSLTQSDGYWGPYTRALFPVGDFYVYESANVYELYLKELLDMGMINKNELGGANGAAFLGEYNAGTSVWAASLEPSSDAGTLGHSFTVTADGFTQGAPSYFAEERMTTLEVFQYLEKFMRMTEKEITDMEAGIITYKYGLNYLDRLTDSEKSTVAFLIAKGILNYEEIENEGALDLYECVTNEQIWDLLYRVASKDARYDFSKVQLTDGETFWQSRGYAEDKYSVEVVETLPICDEDLEAEESAAEREKAAGISTGLGRWLGGLFGLPQSVEAKGSKSFTIIKQFDKINKYTFCGYELSELKNAWDSGFLVNSVANITSLKVKEKNTTVDGRKVNVYQVTFKVKAASYADAVHAINRGFKMEISNKGAYATTAFTKVNGDGAEDITLISQTTLQSVFNNITVLEDKVLMNTETGTTACFLTEKGYALVGNTIYKSNDLIITNANGEVYYNVKVVLGLVCNASFDKLGSNKLFVWKGFKEQSVPVVTDSSSDALYNLYYLRGKKNNKGVVDFDKKGGSYYYKADSISSGLNTLVRTFTAGEGKYKVTVVVDWTYVVPAGGSELLAGGATASTAQDFFDALYERPVGNEDLQKWWDSNIGISNALANMMYGTKNETYVRCGWMAPSISVLRDSTPSGDADLTEVFQSIEIDSKYSSYVNNGTGRFWEYYFNNNAGFQSKELKNLAKNRKWRNCKLQKSKNGYSYYKTESASKTQYVLSDAGVLYVDISKDKDRLSYSTNSIGLSQVVLHTRAGSDSVPQRNTFVKKNGKTFFYAGTKDGYLVLMPSFKPGNEFKAKLVKSGGKFSIGRDQDTALRSALQDFYKSYFGDKALTDTTKGKELQELFGTQDGLDYGKSEIYVYMGASAGRANLGSYDGKNKVSVLNDRDVKNLSEAEVWFMPKVYLPTNQFYLYTNNSGAQIGTGGLGAALTCANIFYSGLNNSIIEAVLSNYRGVTVVGNIANKQKLVIDDTCWTKNGEYWYSEPMKSSGLVSSARSGNIEKAVREMFCGTQVVCAGQYFSLAGYVSDVQLAPPISNKNVKKHGTVCVDKNGSIKVYKSGKYKNKSTSAKYVCAVMKLNDSLVARPLNAAKTRWTLCYSAGDGISSGTDFSWFFGEELSYERDIRAVYGLEETTYTPSSAYDSQKDKFNSMFRDAFAGDVWSLIKAIIVAVSGYLAVMSWLAYCVLTLGTGRVFFEVIALKTENGSSNGIDVLKILTFSLYTLDDEPTLARVLAVTFVCIMIIGCIAYWL